MNRPFRLAAVTSHPVQYQAPLFQRLAQHPAIDLTVYYGHDASVVGDVDREFGIPIVWDRPLLEGYRHVFLSNRASDRAASAWTRRQAAVIGHLRRGRYDAVFIHSYASWLSCAAYVGAWLARTPVLLRTESHRMRPRPAITDGAKSLVLGSLFRHTGAFLPIGEANRQFFEHYRADPQAMFLTPYCVDNDYLAGERQRLTNDREAIRKELGIGSTLPVIVYSGKLIDLKRVDDLIHALHLLNGNGRSAELLIIGDGPCRQRLSDLATTLGVRVTFTGFLNQTALPRAYLCGDIFVLPSSRETWGLVINEAMMFAMPVITTSTVGAAVDLVRHGEAGFIYQAGDRQELARLLDLLIHDAPLRRRMGDAALGRVRDFNYDACVAGVLNALTYVSEARETSMRAQ